MGKHEILFFKQKALLKTLGILISLLCTSLAMAGDSAQIAFAACALNQPICEYCASSTQLLSTTNPQYFILDNEDDVITNETRGNVCSYLNKI